MRSGASRGSVQECRSAPSNREARTHGLCLRAYPDTAGDTPAGTLVAVGATAGLGLGRILPIEQVTSATLVLGSGEVVRVGASHALGGPPFARQGLPDLLGLFTAAEGRGALVTQLGLALAPAPFCVFGRLELVTDEGLGFRISSGSSKWHGRRSIEGSWRHSASR